MRPVTLVSVYTKLMVDVSVRKEIVNWPYMYFLKVRVRENQVHAFSQSKFQLSRFILKPLG